MARQHADVLALQRTAGNRAVTAMVRDPAQSPVKVPSLQRAISTKPSDLRAALDMTKGARRSMVRGRYDKLIDALRYYHAATKPEDKLALTQLIQVRARMWLNKYGDRTTKAYDVQAGKVTQLLADAKGEEQTLRALAEARRKREAAYLGDFDAGSMRGVNSKWAANYAPTGRDVAAGGKVSGGPGADQAAVDLAAKYQLTAAEVTALRTYTSVDYTYINPAMAGSDSWLADNLSRVKGAPHLSQPLQSLDLKALLSLKAEGMRHASMVMQAVAKLPVHTGTVYRGERRAGQEFLKRYAKGAVLPVSEAFSSTSKSRAKAQDFANGEGGDVRPAPDKTVSVVLQISPTNGRDITNLSVKGKEEAEVLLMPGAQLAVTDVKRKKKGDKGNPAATNWYEVHLKQVR